MSGAVTLAQRIKELQKLNADMPKILARTAKVATQKAVEAATEATPPKAGTGRGGYIGKNTLTGELKQAWANDSVIEPIKEGNVLVTALANNQQYASYVENGHRLDKHFVPGLHINPVSGQLERDNEKAGGLVVGAKTKWVKGEFMAEKGKEAYQQAVERFLQKEIARLKE